MNLSQNVELLKEWNYEKNINMSPEQFTIGSNKKIWWKCDKGHEWQDTPNHRKNGRNCPFCSNHRVLEGYNDLATTNPEILKEWDYKKNELLGLTPFNLCGGSNKKAWWKCEKCGHEWQIKINSRVIKKTGCPVCANLVVKKGYNDFASQSPELLEEWDYEKNKVEPSNIYNGGTDKYWWKCKKCGHEWQASIALRKRQKSVCKKCSARSKNVKYNNIEKMSPILLEEWDYKKNRVNPNEVSLHSGLKVWWICKKGHEWQASPANRFKGTSCPICANKIVLKGYNDLESQYPELLEEWDYEKNKVRPNEVFFGSHKKYWWKCKICGHNWENTLSNRVNKNQNCPVCANLSIIEGYNDFETLHPELMQEWNYEKNDKIGIRPSELVSGTTKKVWWICKKGHEWQASVSARVRGNGCKRCALELVTSFSEKVLYYYLKQWFKDAVPSYKPEWLLGKEIDIYLPSKGIGIEYDGQAWHKDKKRDLLKNKLCKENGVILIRVRENKCPKLDNSSINIVLDKNDDTGLEEATIKLLKYLKISNIDVNLKRDRLLIEQMIERSEKEQSLLNLRPDIAKEWNYEKNGILKPENYIIGSHLNVWWKCTKGHEWQATIASRTLRNNNCPICSNQKIIPGVNDFATKYPKLLEEWDYEKNKVNPHEILLNGDNPVWWKCDKGHSYCAVIYSRIKGSQCPYCSGRFAIRGENDLETLFPDLSAEWNYEKNDGKQPFEFKGGSSYKAWWKCKKCGHEWQAVIKSRVNGNGCPNCANLKRRKKELL